MKDYLKQLVEKTRDNNIARCVVREYLQARLLENIQESGAFETWAFVGGTALRFLYSSSRFSEDLDFSLSAVGAEDNFTNIIKKAKNSFHTEGYSVIVKTQTEKTVKSAFLKFPGLLYEIKLSPHQSETISIKVEIDTNPPEGAGFETSVIRKYCFLNILHYDKSSLLAGKVHALLNRKYVKGRDIYDLMWYLSDRTWPAPNMALLNNALTQTGWKDEPITIDNWKGEIARRISEYNWDKVIEDARPFLEKRQEVKMLTIYNLLKLLEDS